MAIMPINDIKETFNAKLLPWYDQNKRDLPWRNTRDPYQIWLSEIILQQTRVAQGLPYFIAFLERFANVEQFANATEDQVLRLWQGLGYYSRGRNMLKTARYIVNVHSGQFPKTYAELLSLPGVGPYTAAAIASFAYKKKHAVVDGNVLRVLSRVFKIEKNALKEKKYFEALANELIHDNSPDIFNQAIMELGATICTPKNFSCHVCPLEPICEAKRTNTQANYPIKSPKTKSKIRLLNYNICTCGDEVLVKKRDHSGIWQGLYDFPTSEELALSIQPNFVSEPFKHLLTHLTLEVRFYSYTIHEKKSIPLLNGWEWVKSSKLDLLPKPILIDRFLKNTMEEIWQV